MAAITLRKIVKTYDNGFTAVKGIDLHIHDHEFMVLVGPSGCGKTTSLRMIAGLEDVSEGDLMIGERRVNDVEPKDRDIAMVFQSYALYPHMTVRDNMAFGLKLRKLPRLEIEHRVDDATRMLGLKDHLEKRPKQLSGGQRQRVALGRAIVRNPQVFLFDEPLSNLDAKLRAEMRYELKTLQQRLRTTMVYVTHDQIEAMTLGDRITVMSHGEIQQVAPPMTVYEFPYNRFVAEFIGSPKINVIPGSLVQADGRWQFRLPSGDAVALSMREQHAFAAHAGKSVALGIRPEHFLVAPNATSVPVQMKVSVVELMGDHQYVYLTLPSHDGVLTMKCGPHFRCAPGDTVTVHWDTAPAHVFASTDEHAQTITLPQGFARQL
ncbi:MAG: sn-glycerol-3-phosphate ABC transporter ATP-binding protein UgpC [Planctomycetes bacterium]|nr:sn-glycerol-3-phosphate ABC transporter ATP-binding protein UgpC [Planctomycetota bacterium]